MRKFKKFSSVKKANQSFHRRSRTFGYITIKRRAQWRHKKRVRITPRANRHRPRCLLNLADRFSGPPADHPKKLSQISVDFYRIDCLAPSPFHQCQIQVFTSLSCLLIFILFSLVQSFNQILINIFLTGKGFSAESKFRINPTQLRNWQKSNYCSPTKSIV